MALVQPLERKDNYVTWELLIITTMAILLYLNVSNEHVIYLNLYNVVCQIYFNKTISKSKINLKSEKKHPLFL